MHRRLIPLIGNLWLIKTNLMNKMNEFDAILVLMENELSRTGAEKFGLNYANT